MLGSLHGDVDKLFWCISYRKALARGHFQHPVCCEKGRKSFDGFYDACREFHHRDPLDPAGWAHRVRLDVDVTCWLVSALAEKDETQALAWLDATDN